VKPRTRLAAASLLACVDHGGELRVAVGQRGRAEGAVSRGEVRGSAVDDAVEAGRAAGAGGVVGNPVIGPEAVKNWMAVSWLTKVSCPGARLDQAAADRYGLNRTDMRALDILGRSGPLAPTDLARSWKPPRPPPPGTRKSPESSSVAPGTYWRTTPTTSFW
jgi:hypothetical protein